MTLPLTTTGEIATFRDVDQFQPGKTQFACGFFSCALVKARTLLEWTAQLGVFEAPMGPELLQARADLAALHAQLAQQPGSSANNPSKQ